MNSKTKTILLAMVATSWVSANAVICYHAIVPKCPDAVCSGLDRNGNPTSCTAWSSTTWQDIAPNSGISGKSSFAGKGTTVTCKYSCYAPDGLGGQQKLTCQGNAIYEFEIQGSNCASGGGSNS